MRSQHGTAHVRGTSQAGLTAPGAAPRRTGSGLAGRLRHLCAWLAWYARELNGEHAYARYAERARAEGGHTRVLSRREFERRRTDRRDADPREGGHCC